MSQTPDASRRRRESVLDLYNLPRRLHVRIALAFCPSPGKTPAWTNWLSSVAVAVVAIAAILTYANWKEWLNASCFGAWLIVSPWLLGFAHTTGMPISIAGGIVVALPGLDRIDRGLRSARGQTGLPDPPRAFDITSPDAPDRRRGVLSSVRSPLVCRSRTTHRGTGWWTTATTIARTSSNRSPPKR